MLLNTIYNHRVLLGLFAIALIVQSCAAPYTARREGYVSKGLETNCFTLVLSKKESKNFPEEAVRKGTLTLRSKGMDCDDALMLDDAKREACEAGANLILIDFTNEMGRCMMVAEYYYFEPEPLDYNTLMAIEQELYNKGSSNVSVNKNKGSGFGSGFLGGVTAVLAILLFGVIVQL